MFIAIHPETGARVPVEPGNVVTSCPRCGIEPVSYTHLMPQQLLRDLCINARVVQYGSIFVPQRMAVYVAGPHSTPRFAAPFLVLVGQPMRPAEPFPCLLYTSGAVCPKAAR